ncbi:hypothetical protein, partial [Helicobacter sp. MIT 05-5294]|uniref:hypothetical protein n=1 Tax=Helicobacter sp. MIT 05-5294 TaxID=1548150 RepID=UPI0010FEA089
MPNKPLTYNRFRAYLRYQFIQKHWNKTFNTKYPYLKVFTDFMDFIPAIKLMESKTFAPELCKFYAAYMFVVGVVYSL